MPYPPFTSKQLAKIQQKEGVWADMQVSCEMCLVMNELTRVIACDKEDWWRRN